MAELKRSLVGPLKTVTLKRGKLTTPAYLKANVSGSRALGNVNHTDML